jgi:UDP-GlcNAc:undecaprenyl-phosphate/decaprenyl-phosphate GlcNAc-1-phosphate transferase
MIKIYLITFFASFGIAFLLTPVIRAMSLKMGWLDKPNYRKINKSPMPLLGGLAIFIGYVSALVMLHIIKPDFLTGQKFIGLLGSISIIAMAGIVDDILYLTPRRKLFYQVSAAIIAYAYGFSIIKVSSPAGGQFIAPDILSLFLTVIWIVGFTNAVNLLDGLDGLAAGVSAIIAMTLFFSGLRGNSPTIALLALPLAGSALGFLRHNFYPAKIFMGDTGSMLLGFSIALISIEGAYKGTSFFTIFVPIIAMGLPFADTGLSILRRMVTGQQIFKADKEHIHHKLLIIAGQQKQAVLTLYFLTISFGFIAVALTRMQGIWAFFAILITVILTIRWANSFGLLDFMGKKKNEKV